MPSPIYMLNVNKWHQTAIDIYTEPDFQFYNDSDDEDDAYPSEETENMLKKIGTSQHKIVVTRLFKSSHSDIGVAVIHYTDNKTPKEFILRFKSPLSAKSVIVNITPISGEGLNLNSKGTITIE